MTGLAVFFTGFAMGCIAGALIVAGCFVLLVKESQ